MQKFNLKLFSWWIFFRRRFPAYLFLSYAAVASADDAELILPECQYCHYQKHPEYLSGDRFEFSDGTASWNLGYSDFCFSIDNALEWINDLWYREENVCSYPSDWWNNSPYDSNFYPLRELKKYVRATYNQDIPEVMIWPEDEDCPDDVPSFGVFYIDTYCTRYSPGHVDTMMSHLKKDFFTAVEDSIKDQKNYIAMNQKKDSKKESLDWTINKVAYVESALPIAQKIFDNTHHELVSMVLRDIENCLSGHKNSPQSRELSDATLLCDRGYANFFLGNFFSAMKDVQAYLTAENPDLKMFELLGEISAELGLYQNAIECLSKVIREDPENKAAYFKRATAYFEQGDFERALEDYLTSEWKTSPIEGFSIGSLEFVSGILKGAVFGASATMEHFVPSMLCSLRGLANGLWAFACDPKEVSQEMIEAGKNLYDFISEEPVLDTLRTLIPEIDEIVGDWKLHTEFRKGELIGTLLGVKQQFCCKM